MELQLNHHTDMAGIRNLMLIDFPFILKYVQYFFLLLHEMWSGSHKKKKEIVKESSFYNVKMIRDGNWQRKIRHSRVLDPIINPIKRPMGNPFGFSIDES